MNKQRFFRCFNPKCSPNGVKAFDFWADKPVCPNCGGTPDNKRCGLTELTITHFDDGSNTVACDPTGPWKCHGKENVSGEPGVVTCPMCRSTPAWEEANADRGEDSQGGIRIESPAWQAHMERVKAKGG